MRFRVLGSVTAVPQTPTAPKVRSVLAVLLTRANQPVSAQALANELWGDTPPRTAVSALQVYISQLRRTLKRRQPAVCPPICPATACTSRPTISI